MKEKNQNFYFTYGSSENMPFQGGWTRVVAKDIKEAITKYKSVHPLTKSGLLNCCDYYSEDNFQKSGMQNGNLGSFEHEVIEKIKKHQEVER